MPLLKNTKMVVRWIFHLALLPWVYSDICPNPEELAPHCWCLTSSEGGSLICKDFFDKVELRGPIEATIGFKMSGLTIQNSTLRYLPHDLFMETTFERIQFIDTFLMALSDDELAFEGLEDHLFEIRASGTGYSSQWDLAQLRNLKKMKLIDIHSIHFDTMSEDLPEFPELSAFGLTKANVTHISDNAFAKCPRLSLLALNDNDISSLKRSMLPNPANHLSLINLQNNKLSTFPDDFFTELPSLKDLYLENNRFITLDERAFSNILGQLVTLYMKGNPFTCDCRLIWITSIKMPMWFVAECFKPVALQGYSLKYLESRDLRC